MTQSVYLVFIIFHLFIPLIIIQGDLIYVNCASSSDFATIDDVVGIDLEGRIAIARRCDMMTMEQVRIDRREFIVAMVCEACAF